jgi:hypothetical protein
MNGDHAARFLHRRSELGYTDRPDLALWHEPEAVSADEQRRLTAQARLHAAEREREAWRRFEQIVMPELVELGHALDRALASDLRVLARQLERISRKLSA